MLIYYRFFFFYGTKQIFGVCFFDFSIFRFLAFFAFGEKCVFLQKNTKIGNMANASEVVEFVFGILTYFFRKNHPTTFPKPVALPTHTKNPTRMVLVKLGEKTANIHIFPPPGASRSVFYALNHCFFAQFLVFLFDSDDKSPGMSFPTI